MNSHHQDLLESIELSSGKATKHTFLDSYLGSSNPRYAIDMPTLRGVAKMWSKQNRDLSPKDFVALIGSLIKGKSSTEKFLAGTLLDYATAEQREFHPKIFDQWLEHLTGWAEIDSVCTGIYTSHSVSENLEQWRPMLNKFSKSKNITKRRASLVLLCSPVSKHHDLQMEQIAIQNIERLKSEKEILITKAISWLLRSMIKHYRKTVAAYVKENADTLPAIAVRETKRKLETGKK